MPPQDLKEVGATLPHQVPGVITPEPLEPSVKASSVSSQPTPWASVRPAGHIDTSNSRGSEGRRQGNVPGEERETMSDKTPSLKRGSFCFTRIQGIQARFSSFPGGQIGAAAAPGLLFSLSRAGQEAARGCIPQVHSLCLSLHSCHSVIRE